MFLKIVWFDIWFLTEKVYKLRVENSKFPIWGGFFGAEGAEKLAIYTVFPLYFHYRKNLKKISKKSQNPAELGGKEEEEETTEPPKAAEKKTNEFKW